MGDAPPPAGEVGCEGVPLLLRQARLPALFPAAASVGRVQEAAGRGTGALAGGRGGGRGGRGDGCRRAQGAGRVVGAATPDCGVARAGGQDVRGNRRHAPFVGEHGEDASETGV